MAPTRIALALEYDGRGFCGFQSQAARCGVQDALEQALASIAGSPVAVAAAGRTDAGVHATSQVVHFDAPAERPLTAWVRGVNAALPPAAAVLWAHPVDRVFHARFAATGRHYTYLLIARPERPALLAGRAGWYHRPLDVPAMHAACEGLLGTHDFSADAFLHHMIRNLVGALVRIGAGKADAAWLARVLASRDRSLAAPTFAPDGLYFTGADYDPRFGLPPTRRDVALVA